VASSARKYSIGAADDDESSPGEEEEEEACWDSECFRGRETPCIRASRAVVAVLAGLMFVSFRFGGWWGGGGKCARALAG
jgi:hypothetical protein